MSKVWAGLLSASLVAGAQAPVDPEIAAAKAAITAKDFAHAKELFRTYAKRHPNDAQAALGLGDAELGLHEYEAAELEYRHAVALQPELWIAHKDLVLVEAKLHRWEEFDRERTLLRMARERGAANITARESDVIDSFEIAGNVWTVREYFQPVGRSETRYNFEHFRAGRVAEYISLEPAEAAESALKREEQVKIGSDPEKPVEAKVWSLNWYTGSGHGTVKRYDSGEPKYEAVRADVLRWLRAKK